MSRRPELTGLRIADPSERWRALGFAVSDDRLALGGVRLLLGAPGKGIVSWALRGVEPPPAIDGLVTEPGDHGALTPAHHVHPNGAIGLDHIVVVTPDFDRTRDALAAAELPLRRVRHVQPAGFRQGFRRLGPAIFELVEARHAQPGPAQFWGLVVVVEDLDGLARRLDEQLGEIKPAVQQERRIATLRPGAGLSLAVAFMDPEPR